jgi:hypothetical protein
MTDKRWSGDQPEDRFRIERQITDDRAGAALGGCGHSRVWASQYLDPPGRRMRAGIAAGRPRGSVALANTSSLLACAQRRV